MRFRVAVTGLIIAAVAVIYRDATWSYFFNDDFHWLQEGQRFEAAGLLQLGRYGGFYRPVIEVYFFIGRTLFGCEALPFHVLSVAIHLANTLALFLLARALTANPFFAGAAAALFVVQPGYVEAVAWVAAITDLLPATWYLLTLWLHLRFLQRGHAGYYAASLATFATCLLTHESSATLLAMMLALEVTWIAQSAGGTAGLRAAMSRATLARAAVRYAPFVLLFAGMLTIAYVVNSRHYVVREGFYAFGWHAVPNILDYIVGMYVGERKLPSYLVIAAVLLALVVRGTPRVRFFVLWILVTLLPASFFTWGNVSRYLYIPTAGFALLLAEMVVAIDAVAARRTAARAARMAAIVLIVALDVRFAVFAAKASAEFRARTVPYERLRAALQAANAAPAPGAAVEVGAADVYGIPDMYVQPAGQIIYCRPDVQVMVRP